MSKTKQLSESFGETRYQLSGHGKRNIAVLKDAFLQIEGDLQSDMYGSGKIMEDFQDKFANLLGKESAVFFPSGTMAQQIALRIWCDEKGIHKVGYHPLSHLEIHEEDGLKELHPIETVLLADKNRVVELEDIKNLKADVACVLLELPQREIGGQLPTYETLEQISSYCRNEGIKLHLDGARLLEVLPYYKKTAAELSALFDSVYLSFYKGIGGIAGAILAGNQEFINKSKVWKRRYGGDLISLYPYILSADYYYEKRKNKMSTYYHDAKELAAYFNRCPNTTTLPEIPVSNMFHVHFHKPKEHMEDMLTEIHAATKIGITSYVREIDEQGCYFEVSLGDNYSSISKNALVETFTLLHKKMI